MTPIYRAPLPHWPRKRLRFLVEGVQNGVWGSEVGEDDIDAICVRVADFDWDHLKTRFADPTIRSFPQNQLRKLALKSGDLLIEKSGGGEKTPVGRIVSYTGTNLAVSSNFVGRIRPIESVNSSFLCYLLASLYVTKYSRQFIKQNTGIQNLDTTALFSQEVLLPDLPSQNAIADFLDRETARINQLIEKKQRLVKLMGEKRSIEIAEVVKRGLNSDVGFKGTDIDWLGKVPAHWKHAYLKHLFRQTKRQGYSDLTVLSVYRDYGVIVKSSRDDNINKTPEDVSMYQLVNPGDLVINKMKAWQGSLGISEHNGITSPDYVVFKPTAPHHPKFVHHFLRAQPLPTVYRMISNGIRLDQWRLEPEKFRNLPIFLPSYDEQVQISDHIERIIGQTGHLIELTESSIERLNEFRSALITAAVTGQIDVAKWGTRGETERCLDRIAEEIRP